MTKVVMMARATMIPSINVSVGCHPSVIVLPSEPPTSFNLSQRIPWGPLALFVDTMHGLHGRFLG